MTEESHSSHEGTERRPWWALGCGPDLAPGDLRNLRRFHVLLILWLAAFVAARLIVAVWPGTLGAWAYAIAGCPAVLLLAGIIAFIHFIREADELTRKIQLESLAFGFGAGFWFMFSYLPLERAGAPRLDVNDAAVAMLLAYLASLALAQKRYS